MTVDTSPGRPEAPLLSLQVLRAVAALLVLLHHAGYDADALAARNGAAPFSFDRVVDLGFGVHLFFVISGFIMLRTARGFASVRGAARFMARRVVRVVPLYWSMTSLVLLGTAMAPGLLHGEPGNLGWVAGSYFFVPVARGSGSVNPVLGQGWTLDYEMFFYALFALAMPMTRRVAIPVLAGTLIGLVVLGRAVAPPFAAVSVWTDALLLEFLFGLGLGVAAERGWRLGPAAAAATVLCGALGAVALGPVTGRFDALAPCLREGLPAALVIGGCVFGPRWSAGRAVSAMALVGDASYSLYLSHPFAVRLLSAAWLRWDPFGSPPALYLATACATAVGAALLLHRWVERPMTKALGRSALVGRAPHPILPEGASRRPVPPV